MEHLKEIINTLTNPKILFPSILFLYFFIFPPNDYLLKINKRLKLYNIWTKKGAVVLFSLLIGFFAFGLTDPNFQKIVAKPDNVPIVGLIFLVVFFLWLSMYQARENDQRIAQGKLPNEAEDAKEKILVWPDLVYIEFIALILCA
ncbi:MAG: hypothetical protein KC733_06580, partial [Candidatus Omnitrophica bacterium]|nr:hypothetical protein [Candidatus Omnitrophota bacterium]